MPSGAKKRKAAKKKKELQSHGEEDLKHEEDKVKLEDGSQNLHITIEPPKKGLPRSSSTSSSRSSEEKSPGVELAKETDSFANEQIIENFPRTEDTAALLQDTTTSSSNTVEPAMKDKLGFVDEKATVSEVLVELEKRIDEASAALHDGAVAASDAKASAVKEDEDKLDLSYNAPTVDAKDTPTRECYEHQPPVTLAPRPAQTTSWKSCCGLFEMFAGSNR